MKTETKFKLLIWSVVVLAILNISTLATIIFRNYKLEKRMEMKPSSGFRQIKDADKFSGRFFRNQLKLNAEQMAKFKEFNPLFRKQAREITMDLARIRREMHDELVAEKSDTFKLNMLSDSVGILHGRLKKLSFRYYLDMKAICTPDQQENLEIIFRDVFVNEMPMGHPGPRPGGGGRVRPFGGDMQRPN